MMIIVTELDERVFSKTRAKVPFGLYKNFAFLLFSFFFSSNNQLYFTSTSLFNIPFIQYIYLNFLLTLLFFNIYIYIYISVLLKPFSHYRFVHVLCYNLQAKTWREKPRLSTPFLALSDRAENAEVPFFFMNFSRCNCHFRDFAIVIKKGGGEGQGIDENQDKREVGLDVNFYTFGSGEGITFFIPFHKLEKRVEELLRFKQLYFSILELKIQTTGVLITDLVELLNWLII